MDYLALLDHYGGECNKAVRVKEAEALRPSLIYKNERAVSFKNLLIKMQTIFTGFYENGEIPNDLQKIRLIFTYEFIYYSLASEAASIGDHNPLGVANVNTCG